jgi:hypothetical protein
LVRPKSGFQYSIGTDMTNTQSQSQSKAATDSSRASLQAGLLQRKCACGKHTIAGGECNACSKERETILQRSAINREPVNGRNKTVPPIVQEVLRSPGQPLDSATRAFMEPRFGHDFSRVRVHANARAAESARAVNALAYTVGREVVFGSNQYEPSMSTGKRLLAHELAHVVQQQGNSSPSLLRLGDPDDAAEQSADQMAAQVMERATALRGSWAGPLHVSSGLIQRAAIHSGRILNEGSCEHLACDSRWGQCDSTSPIVCPAGSAAASAHPDCTDRHFKVSFACEGRTGTTNTIQSGCRDTDRIITKPHTGWTPSRHCGQDLVVCGNHAFVHGTLWDRSNLEAWEVTPQILTDLGVGGDIRNGAIYPSETDPAFLGDSRCRPAATAPSTRTSTGTPTSTSTMTGASTVPSKSDGGE